MADDKFTSGVRFLSKSEIIEAIDIFFVFAMRCNSVINSGSSETLVWWPDKETDSFFIYIFPPIKQSYSARCKSSYFLKIFPFKLFNI